MRLRVGYSVNTFGLIIFGTLFALIAVAAAIICAGLAVGYGAWAGSLWTWRKWHYRKLNRPVPYSPRHAHALLHESHTGYDPAG